MSDVTLAHTTGHRVVDESLRWIIGALEPAFSQRVRAYYAKGSYIDGTNVPTSDIDLTIVFKDRFLSNDERRQAVQVFTIAPSTVELDVDIMDEAELAGGVEPSLKLASLLVYGQDIRDDLHLLPIDNWARLCMHKAYYRTITVFHRPTLVTYPLAYPDPCGAFYGYDQQEEATRVFDQAKVRLSNGSDERTTRALVAVTLWTATALLAHHAHMYVVGKNDCLPLYREHINDDWTSLLDDLYNKVKRAWRCAIPQGTQERELLREICARTLEFENCFLATYKDFVLSELRGSDERATSFTLWALRQLPYHDQEITQALHPLREDNNPQLRQAATDILGQFSHT